MLTYSFSLKKKKIFFLRFHSLKKHLDVDILKATALRLVGSFFKFSFLCPRSNGRISNWCCHWAPTNIHRSWHWCTTPSNRTLYPFFFPVEYFFSDFGFLYLILPCNFFHRDLVGRFLRGPVWLIEQPNLWRDSKYEYRYFNLVTINYYYFI